jgi:hypothetical protein
MGNSIVTVDKDSKLTIKLIISMVQVVYGNFCPKNVDNKVITDSDLKNIRTFYSTNVHLEGFEPGGNIRIGGPKFRDVISRLFPQS